MIGFRDVTETNPCDVTEINDAYISKGKGCQVSSLIQSKIFYARNCEPNARLPKTCSSLPFKLASHLCDMAGP